MKRFAGISALILSMVFPIFGASSALAAAAPDPAAGAIAACQASGGVYLSIAVLSGGSNCITGNAATGGIIVVYLTMFLKLLARLLGGVIVLMLVIAGIQYITSAGDPGLVKGAKDRITNAITALVLFAFMYAILNFLIPGGIFR